MLGGIKRWFRRNQTLIAVGVGVVGAGYVVKEFVVAKLKQVQERNRLLRMQDEK